MYDKELKQERDELTRAEEARLKEIERCVCMDLIIKKKKKKKLICGCVDGWMGGCVDGCGRGRE